MISYSDTLEDRLDQMSKQNGPQELADGLAILVKLFNNIAMNPIEDKYRHLKLSNKTLQTKLYGLKLSEVLFRMLGFTKTDEEYYLQDKDLGTFIAGLNSVKRAEMLSQAFLQSDEEYQKAKGVIARQRQLERQQELEQKRVTDLQAQADYDKQERKHIKTKDSVAKDQKFGANVKRCEDVGINTKQQKSR